MGAWIEISVLVSGSIAAFVAPLVGAWIEILCTVRRPRVAAVAPLVGAWIEIFLATSDKPSNMSLLSWERGLKSMYAYRCQSKTRRSSRGSVD